MAFLIHFFHLIYILDLARRKYNHCQLAVCEYFLHLHHNGPKDIPRIIYHNWINLLRCCCIVVFCPTYANDHRINIIIVSVSESFSKVSEMLFYDYYHSCRRSSFSPPLHTQLNHLYYSSFYPTNRFYCTLQIAFNVLFYAFKKVSLRHSITISLINKTYMFSEYYTL